MPPNGRDPLTFPPGGLVDSTPWGYGKGGVGGVIRPPNVGLGLPALGRVLTLPLPEDSPIPDAHEFNPTGGPVATAAVTAAPVVITGATVTLPEASYGVIRYVSLYIVNMLVTTNVDWYLLVDGQVQQGYGPVTIFPRAASSISNTFDAKIRLTGPCTVTMQFMNRDGGAYNIGGAFGGWHWPQASDERWKTSGI